MGKLLREVRGEYVSRSHSYFQSKIEKFFRTAAQSSNTMSYEIS